MELKEKTLRLKNWAVIGATDDKDRYGYKIVKVLKDNNYSVFPVNPGLEEVAGLECYSNILEISKEIEVVDMVVNPEIGIKVMEEVVEKGIDYVWLQPGARSDKIRDFAQENDINLVEDCIYATLS